MKQLYTIISKKLTYFYSSFTSILPLSKKINYFIHKNNRPIVKQKKKKILTHL